MPLVDFLRHGETQQPGALLGRSDPALSAAGREAVARQTDGRSWSAIIASPLLRAHESADIALRSKDGTVEIDPDWREIDFGDWDGRSHDDLAGDDRVGSFRRDPEANPPPNGEPLAEARQRVAAALDRLVEREGSVLVVAHGGSIRLALSILLGLPLDRLWALRIGCGTRLRVDIGRDAVHGLWGEIIEIAQP